MFRYRTYKIALLTSVLLHLVLLLLYKPLSGLTGIIDLTDQPETTADPLTFELVQDNPNKELVETPRDAEVSETPDDAQFASDKNARAQDMQQQPDVPEGLSYSEGISDHKSFAGGGQQGTPQPQSQHQQQEEQQGESENGTDDKQQDSESKTHVGDNPVFEQPFSSMQQKKFNKDILRGGSGQGTVDAPNRNDFSDDANWDNRDSQAKALGGVSLSTYDWAYAPYLLYMKRRIRDHLYPPQAFYRDAAITGEVTLKFILKRDGNVRDLKFLRNKGHSAFIATSMNAIKASDPFKPLPDSFPDPYLELRWTFSYEIY